MHHSFRKGGVFLVFGTKSGAAICIRRNNKPYWKTQSGKRLTVTFPGFVGDKHYDTNFKYLHYFEVK